MRPILLLTLLALGVGVGPSIASAQQLTLSWADNSGGQAAFIIQRAPAITGPFTEIARTTVGVVSYTDTTVSPGTTYCYQVAATNSAGVSPFSNVACGSFAAGFAVTVATSGTGSGTVVSSPAGISCPGTCVQSFGTGTVLTLTATPVTGSSFGGWSGGGCGGTAPCVLTGNAPVSVAAPFSLNSTAPTPSITSLSPSSVMAGSAAFSLSVTGSGFVSGATATVGGQARTVTFGSATQLTIAVSAPDIASQGNVAVQVSNPTPCAGGLCASNSITLTVTAPTPAPTLSSISPTSAIAGGPAFTLTATGTNFTSNSVVQVNGGPRTTTFVSATQLTAALLAGDIGAAGTPSITVFTPAPGGGTSVGQTLTVLGPGLTVNTTSVVPGGSATATLTNSPGGSTDWLTLAQVGTSDTTYLQWVYVGAGVTSRTWTVTMPTTPGQYEFRFYPNNGFVRAATSPAVVVVTVNVTPSITSLNPSSVVVGSAAFALTVTGSGFVSGATATVGGQPRTVTFGSATQLSIAVSAADVASPGPVAVQVSNPTPCAGGLCASNSVALSVAAPAPTPALASISPSVVTAGGAAFTLAATGSNFTSNSVVQVNGVTRGTTFVSATQLTATILAGDIAAAGAPSVTVVTPAPGGGTSAAIALSVNNPVPTLASISPSTASAGGPAFTLSATGANFTPTSVVRVNGANRTTTFVSATKLTASILAGDIAASGTPSITVLTPTPGGGTSSAQTLTVTAPSLSVNTVSAVPGGSVTATLTNSPGGADWLGLFQVGAPDASYLQWVWVGAGLTSRTWMVSMPTTPGQYEFRFFPNSGTVHTATSPAVSVAVVNPTPTLASLSPASVAAGSPAFAITVTGSGFVSGATATVGGQPRTVTFGSAAQLTIAVQAADVASAGNVPVQISNPTPCLGGLCTSSSVALTATAPPPAPTLSSISPSTASAGGPAFTLSATGANFTLTSVVRVNGANRTTTFVSATQLTASILAGDIAAGGAASITVVNPAPGGGTSGAQTLTVTGPSLGVNATSAVPGGAVTATLTNSPGGADWLGLFQVGSPDSSYLQWVWVGAGLTSRTWTVTMPSTPGQYEFRFFPNYATVHTATSPAVSVALVNPTPAIATLTPASVAAGTPALTVTGSGLVSGATATPAVALTVTGSGFVSGATATVGGQPRTVTVGSATQLTIAVQAADVATQGTVPVQITNPAACLSGLCASNVVNLVVTPPAPAPVLSSISPSTASAGGLAFTLTATGANFAGNSMVQVNGGPRATTVVSPTQLTATILASDIAAGGTSSITVVTPAPGGGTSGAQALTATGPSLGVNPTSVVPGGTVTATLTNSPGGADWLGLFQVGASDASYLRWVWVGAGLTSRTWTVTMPTTPGQYEFRFFPNYATVHTATSPAVALVNPTPAIASLTPASVVAGDPTFALTVTGSNFTPTSVVRVNGVNRTTNFVSTTQLTASIPASDIATTGTSSITVFTPAPGGGTSGAQSLTVTAPSLTVNSTSAVPGGTVTATLTNSPGGADWLGLFQVGASDDSYLRWVWVGAGLTSRTWTVTMPTTPGQYEFRFFANYGTVHTATSPAVTVGN